MKSQLRANEQICRLRQQIHEEENRGKLRELVFRLQIALREEQPRTPPAVRAQAAENPFDRIITK